jgi:hypothetical protein
MCEDFAPNFGDKRTGCCIMKTHRLTFPFSPRISFTQNNMNGVPNLPYFSLFPRLKKKLKDRHSDTIQMIEVESQEVLNTFTDQDFQDVIFVTIFISPQRFSARVA